MKFLVIVFLVCCVSLPVIAGQPVEAAVEAAKDDPREVLQVSRMIKYQMRKCPGKKISRDVGYRLEWARDIVAAAQETNVPVPEHLFAMVLFQESTFRMNALGKKEEKGVGQVMDPERYGCDMSTRIGQLRCSANYLRSGYAKCGTWEGALSHYQSSKGACKPKPGSGHEGKINFRVRRWSKLRLKFPIDKPR